eukprot:scaffold7400_cov100-Isochrysis_galbana.AAC.8
MHGCNTSNYREGSATQRTAPSTSTHDPRPALLTSPPSRMCTHQCATRSSPHPLPAEPSLERGVRWGGERGGGGLGARGVRVLEGGCPQVSAHTYPCHTKPRRRL